MGGTGDLQTLSGTLAIAIEGESLVLNGGEATVTCAGITTGNGVIYVIDAVLAADRGGRAMPGRQQQRPRQQRAGEQHAARQHRPRLERPRLSVPGSSVPGSSVPPC